MNFIETINAISEEMQDCSYLCFPTIVDEPKGKRQDADTDFFDHVFVDQSCGIAGDDWHGTVYFPIPNGKYIAVEFSS